MNGAPYSQPMSAVEDRMSCVTGQYVSAKTPPCARNNLHRWHECHFTFASSVNELLFILLFLEVACCIRRDTSAVIGAGGDFEFATASPSRLLRCIVSNGERLRDSGVTFDNQCKSLEMNINQTSRTKDEIQYQS